MFRKLLLVLGTITFLMGACTPAKPVVEATSVETEVPAFSPSTEAIPGQPVTLTDGMGREVKLEAPAQKVVSLAPSNTEILFAVGAGPQAVGRDTFSDYPAEAQQVTDIGGGFGQLNTEVILTLEPDLILAAKLTPPEQVEILEALGLTVFVLPNPTDFDGLYDTFFTVARLTGHEEQAQVLIEDLQARVAAVEEKLTGVTERPLVFYELDASDPNAPWISGPGTFQDMLITIAGGRNIGSTLKGDWVQISLEELLVRDPDLILLGDYTWGGVTPEDVAGRAGWDALSAVKNRRVYPFDDNLASRPGPRLVDGLEAMAKLFHPELFK